MDKWAKGVRTQWINGLRGPSPLLLRTQPEIKEEERGGRERQREEEEEEGERHRLQLQRQVLPSSLSSFIPFLLSFFPATSPLSVFKKKIVEIWNFQTEMPDFIRSKQPEIWTELFNGVVRYGSVHW